MTHEIKQVAMIGARLKEKLRTPIIVGGCHITALPVQTMEEFLSIDYGVIGEGENTILDLFKYFKGDLKIEEVAGIVYRDNKIIVQTAPRKDFVDLDSLPFPAFHHYFKHKKCLAGRDKYYQIFSSRGCPFKCVFCMCILGENTRRRMPKNIIDEINFAVTEYGPTP